MRNASERAKRRANEEESLKNEREGKSKKGEVHTMPTFSASI